MTEQKAHLPSQKTSQFILSSRPYEKTQAKNPNNLMYGEQNSRKMELAPI